jgi:hypothetical protein
MTLPRRPIHTRRADGNTELRLFAWDHPTKQFSHIYWHT